MSRKNNYRYRRNRQVKRLINQRRCAVLQEMQSRHIDHVLSPPELTTNINNCVTLKESIRSWVNVHGISTRAVNDLLKIMSTAGTKKNTLFQHDFFSYSIFPLIEKGIKGLPKDYRTLLQTPKIVQIMDVSGGKYWYNGIEKNLRLVFSNLSKNISISLNFNMDGLPIFKSSQKVFWPILSTIYRKYINFKSMDTIFSE